MTSKEFAEMSINQGYNDLFAPLHGATEMTHTEHMPVRCAMYSRYYMHRAILLEALLGRETNPRAENILMPLEHYMRSLQNGFIEEHACWS